MTIGSPLFVVTRSRQDAPWLNRRRRLPLLLALVAAICCVLLLTPRVKTALSGFPPHLHASSTPVAASVSVQSEEEEDGAPPVPSRTRAPSSEDGAPPVPSRTVTPSPIPTGSTTPVEDEGESFSEAEYLRGNPDVAAAVAAGSVVSGWEHWETHGRLEGRCCGSVGRPRRPAPGEPACDLRRHITQFSDRYVPWGPCTTGTAWNGPRLCPASSRYCDWPRVEAESLPLASRCFRDKSIVFIGDSVSRYQYLALVWWLLSGNATEPEGAPTMAHMLSWGGWSQFFEGASGTRLLDRHGQPVEICDCRDHRRSRRLGGDGRRSTYLQEFNLRITYVAWLGALGNMSFVPPTEVNITCQAELWRAAKASGRPLPPDVSATCSQPCSRSYCALPGLAHYTYDRGIVDAALAAEADVLILNSGHHSSWAGYEPGQVDTLLGSLAEIRRALPRVRMLWKTTTPINRHDKSEWGAVTDEWETGLRQWRDGLVNRLQNEAGVEEFPAFNLTAALARGPRDIGAYWDRLHFKHWVYAALNFGLVQQLCAVEGAGA